MAIFEGAAFAQDRLMDAAGHILHAYYKAPLVTSRLNQKAVLVRGEEFFPMLEFVDRLQEKLGIEATQNAFFPLYVDYMTIKTAFQEGRSPVMLILGADLARADLGWDCGACGFATCGEFNNFKKEHGGIGRLGAGPSCAWKNFDFGMCCDYACAAAWEMNIDNRILGTFGLLAYVLGYLENVTCTLVLVLGPVGELWWYSRPSLGKWRTHEHLQAHFRNNYTVHFQMFSSDLRPAVKQDGNWWEKEAEFVRVAPDAKYIEYKKQIRDRFMEAAMEVRPKVDAIKAEMMRGEKASAE